MYRNIITIVFSIVLSNFACTDRVLSQSNTVDRNHIRVEEIEIKGNTVFADSQFEKIVSPLEGQKMPLERLSRLAAQLTNYYVDRGYISSVAFVPSQEFTDGIIEIKIVEGSLVAIEIQGLSQLKRGYITSRLPSLEKPLKISDITDSLVELNNNPLIKEIESKLEQASLGENILILEIRETPPLTSQFSLTNNYSPSIGSFGGTANVNYHLMGFGDIVSFDFTKTDGLTRYNTGYSIPFNSRDGVVGVSYTNADSEIVEDPISALDIQADYETFVLNIRQPIDLGKSAELAIGAELELIKSETFVNNDFSFAFVDGLEDGQSRITALRLIQEYFNQSERSSIALRSRFNLGLNLFDATKTELGQDALYWSWQGQTQWLRKLGNLSLISTLNLQLTPDRLLPVEQFSLGGTGSVRGYRSNLSIGDNGVTANVELQIPIVQTNRTQINLIPFVDGGTVWNDSSESIESSTLFSTGIGVSYELSDIVEARIDYAIPLIEADAPPDFSTEQEFSFLFLLRP